MLNAMTTKNDSQLKKEVLEELRWDPYVKETEVGVQVTGGVVTLTGTVTSYPKRLAAADAAHRVTGVMDVANELAVRIPGPERRSDEDIARAVRESLIWNVVVPDSRIQSSVTQGCVTLTGSVDTWTQRRDAERAVQHLAGVTSVVNQIDVNVKHLSAERIRGDIEGALNRRAHREARGIRVHVTDGVVTLSGSVRSWGERHAVEQAAGFSPGVHRVDSQLTVDPYS